MKLLKLTNDSNKRLNFPIRGPDGKRLTFEVGETRFVSPATVQHPTVSPYIGKGLTLAGQEMPKKKELPPVAPPMETKVAPTSENEPSTEEPLSEPEEPADNAADELRDLYVEAPGITESNVDAVLDYFPTPRSLAEATEDDLLELGVSRTYVKRIKKWAKAQ